VADHARLAERICAQLIPGDTVLFKASRGIRMERLAEEMKKLLDR